MNPQPNDLAGTPLKGTLLAAYRALEARVPFVLYALPGKKRLKFIADIEGRQPMGNDRFVIVPWRENYSDGIVIRDTISSKDFLKRYPKEPSFSTVDYSPWKSSTDKLLYKGQIVNAVDMLQEQGGGKVVISRTICGNFPACDFPEQIVIWSFEFLREMDIESLRFLYYTPQTGCWVAATPELLLDIKTDSCYGYSMALAGTRPVSYSNPGAAWDDKNTYEHDLVLDDISSTLCEIGAANIGVCERNVKFHEIEHRCHDIRFEHRGIAPERYLDALNPTPALGGYPREAALDMIDHIELHPRRCYGGYVVIENDDRRLAYVNLRCANVDDRSYSIYAGGGITPDSNPEEEWKETEAKGGHLNEIFRLASHRATLNR